MAGFFFRRLDQNSRAPKLNFIKTQGKFRQNSSKNFAEAQFFGNSCLKTGSFNNNRCHISSENEQITTAKYIPHAFIANFDQYSRKFFKNSRKFIENSTIFAAKTQEICQNSIFRKVHSPTLPPKRRKKSLI